MQSKVAVAMSFFDNLDFRDYGISGTNSIHDTKWAVVQDYNPNYKNRKQDIPDILKLKSRVFYSHSKCQELQQHDIKSKIIKIPAENEYPSEIWKVEINEYQNVTHEMDFA